MQKVIISDTSCLILLDKIGELNLLNKLFGQVTVTQEIANEFRKELPGWFKIEGPINKTYQRCLVKAIAVWFWLWLYVFRWEYLPETDWEYEINNCKTLEELQTVFIKSPKTTELIKLKDRIKSKLTPKT